ncbi:YbaN family protein [Neptunicoccus cionae]|uniref:YbaN family protein n=1 Tax=Neptunicoccus cionae TaxID=2035344 RepID=UPI000C78678A|nr:YbaN family protein [Amylibacter cionae]PLS22769.1 DUF454 domain-containing protein [Amylibacter cionae]
MRGIWFIFGVLSVLAALIGAVLPLLPTVPFLLLAAFCFARSSQRAHDWLTQHPRFGPPIRDWNEKGAIRKPAKIAATVCIAASPILTYFLNVPLWAYITQLAVLCCVMLFIWTRPNG